MKYNAVYVDPKVKVICDNDSELWYQLWLKSRNQVIKVNEDGTFYVGGELITDEKVYKDRILKMGLQYSNFTEFTFEITGSTIFRDILYTINKCPQWATSLRFVNSTFEGFDVRNYPVSSEYKGIKEWEDQFDKYMDKIQETMITDENRVEMPYSMSSTYWIQMNLKTTIDFVNMLRLRMPFFYNVYGKLIEREIYIVSGITISNYYTDSVDSAIEQYFVHNNVYLNEDHCDLVGDTMHIVTTMGLLLFSQFIRQQATTIKGLYDILWHDNAEEFSHKLFYASTPIRISYITDRSRFMRTISNRMCWFSMSSGNDINSWSRIIDLATSSMEYSQLKELMPCKISSDRSCITCKYYDDVKFRKEGVEKRNLPCGLLYMNEDYINQRDEYDNTSLSHFYKKYFNELKNKGCKGVDNE